MTRKLVTLALAACLSLTGCDKVKSLFNRKPTTQATPAPASPADVAEPSPLDTPLPKPTIAEAAPAAPAKPVIDTNAEVVVLCYHRLEGKAGGVNSIEPALFEKQMQAVKDSGIPVISMKDFLAWRRGEKNIPPRAILITLDDGYVSEVTVGVPILKKHGFTATFFVYLDYINTGGKSVTWAQLAELRDQGFEIGSHTVMHQDLRHKPSKASKFASYDAWLEDEVGRSKKVLEDQLGIRCATIAYPFGNHNDKVHEAVRAAGYEAAFTTYGARLGHSTNPFSLGRYDVTAKMPGNQDTFTVATTFSGMVAPSGPALIAQDAAALMVTQPMNNAVITNATPTIKANLSTMGALDAGSIVMRISGFGLVPAEFDDATKTISFTPAQDLKPGDFTVIISAKSNGRPLETRWSFTYNPDGSAASEDTAPPLPSERRKKR